MSLLITGTSNEVDMYIIRKAPSIDGASLVGLQGLEPWTYRL